jgi:hypothetical protein
MPDGGSAKVSAVHVLGAKIKGAAQLLHGYPCASLSWSRNVYVGPEDCREPRRNHREL